MSTLEALVWPRGWVEVQFYSSMTTALEWGEWSAARPGRTLPPGKNRYPLYRKVGRPQGRSRRAENFAPAGSDSWTIRPVVSRYTDWATQPTEWSGQDLKLPQDRIKIHIKLKHKHPKKRYHVEELDGNKTLKLNLILNTGTRFKLDRLFQHRTSSGAH